MSARVDPGPRTSPSGVLARRVAWVALAALVVLIAPFLLHCLAKVPRATPIDYNEGWNAYHAARLMAGGPLYLPVDGFPVTPVNYPPLSFLVFAGFGRLSGELVHTGRILSLACFVLVSMMVYCTVFALNASRLGAALGVLLWIALAVRLAPAEVGSYNEQMLGHAFSSGALYLHSKWRDGLGRRQARLLALLCGLALFVKQILLPVPIALALALLLRDRKRFGDFALAGLALAALFAVATRVLGGPHVWANLAAFERQMDGAQRLGELRELFVARGGCVLLAPALLTLGALVRERTAVPAYLGLSLALGIYAAGGVGIDRNGWLDFFIASAVSFGVLAGRTPASRASWQRPLASLAVLAGILPVGARFRSELAQALDVGRLHREEQAYLADVELLSGVSGPALFEEPLLGFDAGKEFLFDPFSGSQMILSGRLPESILTDRLRRMEFAAVVLTSRAVEDSRRRLERTGRTAPSGPPQRVGWWTRGTLEAVRDHYALHAPDRRRYAFFYFPAQP